MSGDPFWRDDAACSGADVEEFFPLSHGRMGNEPHERRVVRDWCIGKACPVVDECLRDALAHESTSNVYGVRGAMTSVARAAILKKRDAA